MQTILAFVSYFPVDVKNSACIFAGSSLSLTASVSTLIFNSVLYVTILFFYTHIMTFILKSHHLRRHNRNVRVSLRLGGIILTNIIPWIIVSLLNLLDIFNVPFEPSIEALIGLVFFPLNAAINPILSNGWLVSCPKVVKRLTISAKSQ